MKLATHLALLLLCLSAWPAMAADELPLEQLRFFENEIRPLLSDRCFKCHGRNKQKGDLRLDSLSAILHGGESGPAVVRGKPDESLLVEAINYESFEMPPDGKLNDKQIAVLTRWIKLGAPWPGDDGKRPVNVGGAAKITEEDRKFWAFQPVRKPAVPQVDDEGWSRNDIDRFISRKLHQNGLQPSAEADRRSLIRRAYFDLLGIPPTPEAVEKFVNDSDPRAYEKLIDELLESPRYGERWGQHWLDLVRYAESDGFRQDAFRPHAWRYRDYVIRAFNEDKPYDQFVMEQLAGDEIAPHDPDAIDATQYLRHWIYEYNQRDVRDQWQNILNDITDVTADVFLAMGMGCAKCHDHKFDPLLQRDYFRLQAFFGNVVPREDVVVATPEEKAEYARKRAEWEAMTAEIRAQIDSIKQPLIDKLANPAIEKFPPDIQEIMAKPAAKRKPLEHQLAALVNYQVEIEVEKLKLKPEQEKQIEELELQLAEFNQYKPKPLPTRAFAVSDTGAEGAVLTIPDDPKKTAIVPGYPTLFDDQPARIEPVPTAPESTGRRTALARWLVNPDNPLSSRVMVNRVWQYHFGTGLVATASDFGHLGEAPSHPDLLDWLASQFVADGWKLKGLHRRIMTSATYRQTALRRAPEAAQMKDPGNRLLWRFPTRRLEAEQIRDTVLAVTGELDLKMFGPSESAGGKRRSIYTRQIRNTKFSLFSVFDIPDQVASTSQRNETTTPTQSLYMINGPWTLARAQVFAQRLQRERVSDEGQLVDRAYRLAFNRLPSADERTASLAFLNRPEPEPQVAKTQTGQIQGRAGTAASFVSDSPEGRLAVPFAKELPDGDFTIEAVVQLDSLYDDASVRTIAAHWNSNSKNPGWSLGVTSKKSRYKPRNLILQMVGDPKQDGGGYEVIPSNLHLELNKPYYVAASVKLEDTSPAGITFYMQELKQGAKLQTAQAAHTVTGHYRWKGAFTVGSRDTSQRHTWDGLLDDVRLTRAALSAERLLIAGVPEKQPKETVGFWRFDEDKLLADSSPAGRHLTRAQAPAVSRQMNLLIDFCHVLLNSSELLYVD